MPLKNMNEKKDYIEAKTDYAKKPKNLENHLRTPNGSRCTQCCDTGCAGMASEISEAMNILYSSLYFIWQQSFTEISG